MAKAKKKGGAATPGGGSPVAAGAPGGGGTPDPPGSGDASGSDEEPTTEAAANNTPAGPAVITPAGPVVSAVADFVGLAAQQTQRQTQLAADFVVLAAQQTQLQTQLSQVREQQEADLAAREELKADLQDFQDYISAQQGYISSQLDAVMAFMRAQQSAVVVPTAPAVPQIKVEEPQAKVKVEIASTGVQGTYPVAPVTPAPGLLDEELKPQLNALERSAVTLAEARKARELKEQGDSQGTNASTTVKSDMSVSPKTPLSQRMAALAAVPKAAYAERSPVTGHLNTLLLLTENQTQRRLAAGAPCEGRSSQQQQVLALGGPDKIGQLTAPVLLSLDPEATRAFYHSLVDWTELMITELSSSGIFY